MTGALSDVHEDFAFQRAILQSRLTLLGPSPSARVATHVPPEDTSTENQSLHLNDEHINARDMIVATAEFGQTH